MVQFQQSQALTSHFESFWSIVHWVLVNNNNEVEATDDLAANEIRTKICLKG